MLKFDPTLQAIYEMTPKELQHYFRITSKNLQPFYYDLHAYDSEIFQSLYKKQNIQIVTILDKEYSDRLKNIYMPPLVLYCKGNVELLNQRSVAIVGTRNPTMYGKKVTKAIVEEIVQAGFVTVSGLAKGIDFEVHDQTIKNNGKTIAVLGSGFFHIYPKEHTQLSENISKNHLLISEYSPNKKPQKHHFPERNRIIAGLSMGTVVIEAREKSGSLITAQMALNEGRDVFAIPGSIFSPTSKGTNLLIQEGAKLVLRGEDIISELPK